MKLKPFPHWVKKSKDRHVHVRGPIIYEPHTPTPEDIELARLKIIVFWNRAIVAVTSVLLLFVLTITDKITWNF